MAAINDMSSAIAAAEQQRDSAAEAVDSRIQSIREVADRNAGGAAEVAGSTDELGKRAVELREAVQAFGL